MKEMRPNKNCPPRRAISFFHWLLPCFLFPFLNNAYAGPADAVVFSNPSKIEHITNNIACLMDPGHNLLPADVFSSNHFEELKKGTPNFGITKSIVWLRIRVRNETSEPAVLKLSNPGIDSISYYEPGQNFPIVNMGLAYPFSQRPYEANYLFDVHLPAHTEKYIYFRLSTAGPLIVPISIGGRQAMADQTQDEDIFWGIYIGIMIAMMLYNCFVYATTNDSGYFYYIVYVLAVLLTQVTLSGYLFLWLQPANAMAAESCMFLTPILVGVAGIMFIRSFLKVRRFTPAINKGYTVFIAGYILAAGLCIAGLSKAGFTLIDILASVVSLYMLTNAIIIARKGYRPATFFLVAWGVFLTGVFIFVFKNFNLLPYNNFTVYTMPVGSAMEVLLLSFALADRINTLKKEKENSQMRMVEVVLENERIVREQNVMLEEKVAARTEQLWVVNESLEKAMTDLQEAQAQLVESEKTASLGLLTAGIAHEINNPINFVSSGIKPLSRDVQIMSDALDRLESIALTETSSQERRKQIDELKTEADLAYVKEEMRGIMAMISDGARRTADIVQGLHVFSRVDESGLKETSINDGLDATLAVTGRMLNATITVEKNYGELPPVTCYPGKINQVFLNTITNAIYAVHKKYGSAKGGRITIETICEGGNVLVKIKDNGIGMDEETRRKMFDPFFTTRAPGEGVGLGMSIAYKIIASHDGKIQVTSVPGLGAEVVISLPILGAD